jgi:hypothetical protein
VRVVHCKKEDFDVYIGRPSKWGNPFIIGRDGDRNEVVRKYEAYIRANQSLINALPELRNKVLGCWCSPKSCHGDVLIKLLEEFEILITPEDESSIGL